MQDSRLNLDFRFLNEYCFNISIFHATFGTYLYRKTCLSEIQISQVLIFHLAVLSGLCLAVVSVSGLFNNVSCTIFSIFLARDPVLFRLPHSPEPSWPQGSLRHKPFCFWWQIIKAKIIENSSERHKTTYCTEYLIKHYCLKFYVSEKKKKKEWDRVYQIFLVKLWQLRSETSESESKLCHLQAESNQAIELLWASVSSLLHWR